MAAPEGNSFWELRAKHGRDALFDDPEKLMESAKEYFRLVDADPWMKNEAIKSGENCGQIIEVPTARPYTIKGLCIYLDASETWFKKFEKACHDQDRKDFFPVLAHIREMIHDQKYTGAAVGAFNPMIIARDLGLQDHSKIDETLKGEMDHTFKVQFVKADKKGTND